MKSYNDDHDDALVQRLDDLLHHLLGQSVALAGVVEGDGAYGVVDLGLDPRGVGGGGRNL